MANILAIDACTEVCSVSVLTGSVEVNKFIQDKQKPSNLLLPLCNEALLEADIKLNDIDCIAYTKGPGAFTGVRLCIGITQGLAMANNTKTLGVSSLELLAYGAYYNYGYNNILAALDARMDEVYWCQYKNNTLIQQSLNKPEDVPFFGEEYIGVGSAWDCYQDRLINKTGVSKFIAKSYPSAQYLAKLVVSKYLDYVTNELATPLYLRNNIINNTNR